MGQLAGTPSADIPSLEQKRAALDLVLKSNTFSRADQLRSFLRFICEMELEGKASEITEYLIAVKALGRASDFSAMEDSSVRVMAYGLRKKLEEFYLYEQPEAGTRIELAKGSYHPRFVHTENIQPGPSSTGLIPQDGSQPPREMAPLRRIGYLRLSLIMFVAGAAATAALTALFAGKSSSDSVDPVIREAWGPILRPDANVLIAIGNPLHMIFHPYPVLLPPKAPVYPAPAETYSYYRRHRPLPQDASLSLQTVDNAVSMGHVLGIVSAVKLLNSAGATYQVLPEHVAPLPSFRGRNVLLIGSPEDSQAVAVLLENMPFTVEFDPGSREIVVRDRRNNKVYAPKRDDTGHYSQVYGLVTVSPTEGTMDGSRRTIIFSGITSVGCHAAVDFMASPQNLHSLLDRIRAEGYNSFPASYQIIIRATTTPETLLTTAEYEAHAIVDKAPGK
jgi:hypothetical protein